MKQGLHLKKISSGSAVGKFQKSEVRSTARFTHQSVMSAILTACKACLLHIPYTQVWIFVRFRSECVLSIFVHFVDEIFYKKGLCFKHLCFNPLVVL